MSREELKLYLTELYPEAKVEDSYDFPVLFVEKTELVNCCRQLKENEKTAFDFLFCETAIDKQDSFEVVYHLSSTIFHHRMVVKVKLERTDIPEIPSVYELWQSAELFENEIFDLFGIRFINHPNLRRIFLGDEWKGFPLRKDYQDNVNVVPL